MELKNLRTFGQIVKSGGFAKAATKLNYSQSTVSSHVQELETELGVRLFDRLGKRVVLTAAGESLFPRIQELEMLMEKIGSVSTHGTRVSGKIKIAAPESVTAYRLPRVLQEYHRTWPEVEISLVNKSCQDNLAMLAGGEADLALVLMGQIEDDNLVVETLCEADLAMVGAPGTDGWPPRTLVVPEKGASYRGILEEFVASQGLDDIEIMELWSLSAIKGVVTGGLGTALLPLMTVADELTEGTLVEVKVNRFWEPLGIRMAHSKGKWLTPSLSEFMACLRRHIKT